MGEMNVVMTGNYLCQRCVFSYKYMFVLLYLQVDYLNQVQVKGEGMLSSLHSTPVMKGIFSFTNSLNYLYQKNLYEGLKTNLEHKRLM